MMPGGSKEGYESIRAIVEKVAAQVDDGPCVTYIGPGGSGTLIMATRRFRFMLPVDLPTAASPHMHY